MKKRFYFRREVSENNTKNQQYSNDTIVESSYFYKRLINRFLVGCILVSAGILLAESAGSWDITNHLLNKPETFFSPPHVILYSGIALSLVGASIMFLYWRSYSNYTYAIKEQKKLTMNLSIKLVISGVSMLILAGPLDFFWHSAFGLDGLLSPPHLTLTIGMLAGSIGALIGITSYIVMNNSIIQEKRQNNTNSGTFEKNEKTPISIYSTLTIIGILPIWMSSSGLIYMFSLPFSDTEYYNFNLEPTIAATIATVSFPFLISFILVSLFKIVEKMSNKKRKFGAISVTGSIFIIITIVTMMIPNKSLISTIPFYALNIIPILIADVFLSKLPLKRMFIYISGGILGSSFFMLYYPMITHIYNEVSSNQPVWPSLTAPIYFDMISQIYPLLVVPAVGVGILGTIVSSRLINRKN
ncbi:MAG TPA: hypothetical protein VE307_04605 [Nitrososphaeraceae archaeon]|jgi:hypothetical protein|nr:hypothetical protein [Nitrososphaeraceae archaeon]